MNQFCGVFFLKLIANRVANIQKTIKKIDKYIKQKIKMSNLRKKKHIKAKCVIFKVKGTRVFVSLKNYIPIIEMYLDR